MGQTGRKTSRSLAGVASCSWEGWGPARAGRALTVWQEPRTSVGELDEV